MLLYKLKMVWWNTALSPAAPNAISKANSETLSIVCEHIKKLITDFSCDLIAICEVSTKDVAHIYSYLNLHVTDVKVLDLTCVTGRTRFDIAVIYNSAKIHINHKNSLTKTVTGNTVKAAQLVEVFNLDDEQTIQLFLCHWPSRLNGEGASRRLSAADTVRFSSLAFMEEYKDVIVMGDFNDNPYDESILSRLNASRCHDAVRKYPNEYLYNPFWRSVVSGKMYSHIVGSEIFRSGSQKYKQFQGTMWHSYDQIMFSGSFLGRGVWHLNEQSTKVMDEIGFLNDFDDNKNLIDHLPVICEITRL